MRAIPGAHPAGGLRPSNFVPDKIVRIYRIKIRIVGIFDPFMFNPVNPVLIL